ncbi:ATP-dependent helicase HrpB [Paenibacillus sambharensis]|uniref:ATP-dependent helicase HrpB n=1 Tax=Paenibacillus sambharensis TaxID=1803190 RepID=A0A2W1L7T8_9BACL|nr:ATP-dependent helicase HrpB [Paenibacillus sambharensis]PZD96218.1 ATP-dependent helicase HrpB [Paenibacillus sambharensis]
MLQSALPVDLVLPELTSALARSSNAVLVAPPGAGKTTRVPLAVLEEPWMAGKKILMLEPRRMAARSAAHYMASSLGEKVGGTVGYRVRMDSQTSKHTRIEVITEGILTRMLQTDPSLEEAGIVIFDEFHERSLQADLGLALCLEAQRVLREDLRLLVMSATIEAKPVASLMGGAPVIISEGKRYPVETRYYPRQGAAEQLAQHTVRVIKHAIAHDSGDILVFLPGEGEIRRVQGLLLSSGLPDAEVLPLYGALSQEAQEKALARGAAGKRKIVLSTSIAETSLTVEGVHVVIDAGLMRVPRFSPRTGMSRLETVQVSAASAEQRRGRAGRLGPGVCYRLWTEEQQQQLEPSGKPEMMETDLAPLMLELAAWGTHDPAQLSFLDQPPEGAVNQAVELLQLLGAMDKSGQLSIHGRKMAEQPLHPRLSHMVLRAMEHEERLGVLACDLAVLLAERDVLRWQQKDAAEADIVLRLQVLRAAGHEGETAFRGGLAEMKAAKRLVQEASRLKRSFGLQQALSDGSYDHLSGVLLAYAYPDRVGMPRRSGGAGLQLSGGRGAVLQPVQPLSAAPMLAAAELDDTGTAGRIRLAAWLEPAELERYFADSIKETRSVFWDAQSGTVRARLYRTFGSLILQERTLARPDPQEVAAALMEAVRTEGLDILPWNKTAVAYRQRLAFLHQADASWPDVSDEALLERLDDWLLPFLDGLGSRNDLQRLQVQQALEALVPWDKRQRLNEGAPTHCTVPSGSRIPVDYSDPSSPVVAVRLQELFGLHTTPLIGFGRMPVTLHLLSPASRPVQVTRDLASFWRNTYHEVKKDLKGRYPKHYWPDDPLTAVPTNRVRPRQQG